MRNGDYTFIVAPAEYAGRLYRGKYCYEHHYVYWKRTGRLPERNKWMVVHKNGLKTDNRIENLEMISASEKSIAHAKRTERIEVACGWCGKVFKRTKKQVAGTLKIRRFNKLFCSIKCGATHQWNIRSGSK